MSTLILLAWLSLLVFYFLPSINVPPAPSSTQHHSSTSSHNYNLNYKYERTPDLKRDYERDIDFDVDNYQYYDYQPLPERQYERNYFEERHSQPQPQHYERHYQYREERPVEQPRQQQHVEQRHYRHEQQTQKEQPQKQHHHQQQQHSSWWSLLGVYAMHTALWFSAVYFGLLLFSRLIERSKSFRVHRHGAVIVSGASVGIGRAIAFKLAEYGYTVFAGVRSQEDGEELQRAWHEHHGKVQGERDSFTQRNRRLSVDEQRRRQQKRMHGGEVDVEESVQQLEKEMGSLQPIQLEVRDDRSVKRAVSEVKDIMQEMGVRDFVGVVSNAGVGTIAALEGLPIEELQEQFDVNVTGGVRLIQQCLPMLRACEGRVIWIGSVNGINSPPGQGAYSATKHAIEALADAWRVELAPTGVSVSLIQPGLIHTSIIPKMLHGRQAYIERMGGSLPGEPSTTEAQLPSDSSASSFRHRTAHDQNIFSSSDHKSRTTIAGSDSKENVLGVGGNERELLELYDPWLQYQQNFHLSLSDSWLAGEPHDVANKVLKAMTDDRPRPRYIVGWSGYLLLYMRAYMPDRLWDLMHQIQRYRLTGRTINTKYRINNDNSSVLNSNLNNNISSSSNIDSSINSNKMSSSNFGPSSSSFSSSSSSTVPSSTFSASVEPTSSSSIFSSSASSSFPSSSSASSSFSSSVPFSGDDTSKLSRGHIGTDNSSIDRSSIVKHSGGVSHSGLSGDGFGTSAKSIDTTMRSDDRGGMGMQREGIDTSMMKMRDRVDDNNNNAGKFTTYSDIGGRGDFGLGGSDTSLSSSTGFGSLSKPSSDVQGLGGSGFGGSSDLGAIKSSPRTQQYHTSSSLTSGGRD